MMFMRLREGKLLDLASYDTYRLMGAVPVSGPNFYKLLSSKSHTLLYPGGVREALHRKVIITFQKDIFYRKHSSMFISIRVQTSNTKFNNCTFTLASIFSTQVP